MSPALPFGEISALILLLHEKAHELGHREMQRFALDQLAQLVPFDGAVLATGTLQGNLPEPHDVLLEGMPPGFIDRWMQVRHEDHLIIQAMAQPGRSLSHATHEGSLYGEAAAEHARRSGIAHALCNVQVYADSQLCWVMALSRERADQPYTELERVISELVAPHIVAAVRRARLAHLRVTSRLIEGHGQASALINRDGLILEAEPTFPGLLRRAWRAWSGPHVPPELRDAADDGRTWRPPDARIVLRFDAVDDGFLVLVREALAADSLTEREREIAEAFSLGDTSRQVAEKLGVAPNTVRRHLANVYDKLGISSKAELERMIRSVD
ncbi:MAG: helix-turn-helix transcriptional regulator [Kofleriaceae bacterium]